MRIARLALSIALPVSMAVVAGCTSTKMAEPAAPAAKPVVAVVPTAAPSATPAQPAPTSTVRTVTVHPLDDSKSALAGRSFFFDFDSFVIHDSDRPLLDAHAKYLSTSRTAKVRIEGHADERGGREYNLALGQKRAEAVRKSLQLLGAPEAEMEATSFGKERPKDPGHDESAWAKNRRADLNYVSR